ncbi:MAG TPA: methyltransferase domain-containing protein [Rhizomicrobium sp.]|nr:methyltransferase domain-containing protein [Rhizomicrobium sp.]
MNAEQIRKGIEQFGPWFYSFDFGEGLRTTPAIPPEVAGIHDTRLAMLDAAVSRHFGGRTSVLNCLDIGCHQGFYSIAMARRGWNVTGVDARDESLFAARFASSAAGFPQIAFHRGLVETLARDENRAYDLTLFLGVLYHVEDPMLCLRQVAAVTKEMCVIETQVVDEVEGYAEWGARAWTRPYQGILALIDESGEFQAGNRETGVTPMATCPSPKALLFMCRQAGFARAEILSPPPGAYEQHARGKRVVCAAWK